MSRKGLVWSRARVERDWALLPPEGVAESVLPEWRLTVSKVLPAPAVGARFAQYDLVVAPGGGTQQQLAEGIEAFLYVLDGQIRCDVNGNGPKLDTGGYVYMRPGSRFSVTAETSAHLLWLKKRYVPLYVLAPRECQTGRQRAIPPPE